MPPVTTSTIAQLAVGVASRMQDDSYIFWQQRWEYFSALAEAMNDLILLVGRPTITYNTTITIQPNTVWQAMPANMIAITNLRGSSYNLWKTDIHTMDYLQGSWAGNWETDVGDTPMRYGPCGWTKFFVHPAPTTPITMNVVGISLPVTTPWPPDGTEHSPFHSEIDVALQLYATAYLRLKQIGNDALIGDAEYAQYLDIAQRASSIEDRRDALIFSRSLGTPSAPSLVSLR